mmetsp:Transcript_121111/g.347939  ORF Transcript_121111/g.347939 Transcript_121111/m.347939 type:complete len:245 (-) Transcript_121111:200-934(-)
MVPGHLQHYIPAYWEYLGRLVFVGSVPVRDGHDGEFGLQRGWQEVRRKSRLDGRGLRYIPVVHGRVGDRCFEKVAGRSERLPRHRLRGILGSLDPPPDRWLLDQPHPVFRPGRRCAALAQRVRQLRRGRLGGPVGDLGGPPDRCDCRRHVEARLRPEVAAGAGAEARSVDQVHGGRRVTASAGSAWHPAAAAANSLPARPLLCHPCLALDPAGVRPRRQPRRAPAREATSPRGPCTHRVARVLG